MNALEKLVKRCNEMDITEQLNWLGDAILPGEAAKELSQQEKKLQDLKQMMKLFIRGLCTADELAAALEGK